jgi:hypothetical protein
MVPTVLDKKVLARQLRFGRCGSGRRTVTTGIEKTTLVVLWVKVKITISSARKCGRVNGLGTGYHYRFQSWCSLLCPRLLKLLRFWMEKSSQSKCGFMHASSSRQRTSRCDKAVIAAVFFSPRQSVVSIWKQTNAPSLLGRTRQPKSTPRSHRVIR